MSLSLIKADTIGDFLSRLDDTFSAVGEIFLTGETTHVSEGWRPWTTHIEFASSVGKEDRAHFNESVAKIAKEMGINVTDEFPGEVIPLPAGFENRSRDLSDPLDLDYLSVRHFDPYSIAYRYIARGLEQDYQLVLAYLDHGWISEEEMGERLEGLLPSLSMDTIQQDPAEFRRRYIGLLQMWRANAMGHTHRMTPV
jgi:hypothetical protein